MSSTPEPVETPTETEPEQKRGFGEWVKYLWDEGIARKFIITHDDKNIVDLPLLIVVIAALVAPWLVAIGIVIAVVLGATISVKRKGGDDEASAEGEPESAVEGDAGTA